jgi:hypothetical protein
MKRRSFPMKPCTASLILLLLMLPGCQGQQERLQADIERAGGSVEIDIQAPGRPLVAVDLHGANGVDALLARLEGQARLRKLDLAGTDVTNAGLTPLRGLSELEELNLSTTQVGDEGLEHLTGLKRLRELGLGGTPVTDAGVVHLRRLKRLDLINLAGTKISPEGLKELRAALPRTAIQTMTSNAIMVR